MAGATTFTLVPPCTWACHSQEGSQLRVHTGLTTRQRGLVGHGLRQHNKATVTFSALRTTSSHLTICASSEFAQKESSKFRDDLAEELGKYQDLADVRGRIADVCAKALHNYATTYNGGLEGKPIEDMKKALQEEGLPYEQALCCAIWWVRAYLRRDWEQYCTAKR